MVDGAVSPVGGQPAGGGVEPKVRPIYENEAQLIRLATACVKPMLTTQAQAGASGRIMLEVTLNPDGTCTAKVLLEGDKPTTWSEALDKTKGAVTAEELFVRLERTVALGVKFQPVKEAVVVTIPFAA
ncbi:MAG: hypothetical protein WC901_02340 [Candidatus Margulisiibacteriota bacterium]